MRIAIAAAAAALLMTAAPAGAHPLPDLGGAVKLVDGLFEVPLRTGPAVTTHGADPAPPGLTITGRRPPVCASTHRNAVLYGRPAGAADRSAWAAPQIEDAVFGANAALDLAALESGARHADLRVACTAAADLRIDTFTNRSSPAFADVIDAARAAGATDPDTDYVIFYDDPSVDTCGVATFLDDDRPTADNISNRGGGYAVVYSGCWDAHTTLHEIAHTQGAVQAGAPNASGAGHCRDEVDVMCYADGGARAASMLQRCEVERFDCGYDDYFDVAPEAGEFLAQRWNLGSAANRFITLSDVAPGEAVDPADAVCAVLDCPALPDAEEAVEEEEEWWLPGVRILRGGRLLARRRAAVTLACPPDRDPACRGRLELRSGKRRLGSRRFLVRPGRRLTVRIGLRGRAAAQPRRVRAVADDLLAAEPTVRVLHLRA